jgi:hypothetical protein
MKAENKSRRNCPSCARRRKEGVERLYCKMCDTIVPYNFNNGATPWTGEIDNDRAVVIRAGFTYTRQLPKAGGGRSE